MIPGQQLFELVFNSLSITVFAPGILISSLTGLSLCTTPQWNSDTNPFSEMWSMCSPRCLEVTQNIDAPGCHGPLTFGIAAVFPVQIFVSTQGMERKTLFSSFFRASGAYTRASCTLACSPCNSASSGSFAFSKTFSRPLATSNPVPSTAGFLLVGNLPTYNIQLAWVLGLGTWLSPSNLQTE